MFYRPLSDPIKAALKRALHAPCTTPASDIPDVMAALLEKLKVSGAKD